MLSEVLELVQNKNAAEFEINERTETLKIIYV